MAVQHVFQRIEFKYIISSHQRKALEGLLEGRMIPDEYGRTLIRNIYYDTPDFRLIRSSLEKPVYKEKLRLRAYGDDKSAPVFAELKKKYRDIVFKRRVSSSLFEANMLLGDKDTMVFPGSRIASEIRYFKRFYGSLVPKAFLTYKREAYLPIRDEGLRLTIDDNILGSFEEHDIYDRPEGVFVLPEELSILEIKVPEGGAVPLWLARSLSDLKIRKGSFSKYGALYLKSSASFLTQESPSPIESSMAG